MNGFVFNNTISPNKQFFFRYQNARSINPSCFACKIALFDNIDDSLLFYNSESYAHELNDPEEINWLRSNIDNPDIKYPLHDKLLIATWSIQGNMLYILEYIPSYSKTEKPLYSNLFFDLKNKSLIRTKYNDIDDDVITRLKIRKENFDEEDVKNTLKSLGLFNPSTLIGSHKPRSYFTRRFLKYNKWYM